MDVNILSKQGSDGKNIALLLNEVEFKVIRHALRKESREVSLIEAAKLKKAPSPEEQLQILEDLEKNPESRHAAISAISSLMLNTLDLANQEIYGLEPQDLTKAVISLVEKSSKEVQANSITEDEKGLEKRMIVRAVKARVLAILKKGDNVDEYFENAPDEIQSALLQIKKELSIN